MSNLQDLEQRMDRVDYQVISDDKDKTIADLEAKLEESEKRIQAYEEIVEQKDKEISFANRDKTCIVKQLNDPKAYVLLEDYKELKQQLAMQEHTITNLIEDNRASQEWYKKQLEESEKESNARYKSWQEEIRECDGLRIVLAEVRKQLAVSEKNHLLDEKEWQDYCAFKHIEPEIRGCLDREREYKKQLEEKDKEITQRLVIQERDYNQDKISFAVEQINKIKNDLYENEKINIRVCDFDEIDNIFDNQIKQLKEMK